ncbi:MAG: dihydroorotate dehydrogenase [Planctomycetota bacterium]
MPEAGSLVGPDSLGVSLGSLHLANPVLSASGTFGYGAEMGEFFDLSLPGAVIVKSVTVRPRIGNPPPRLVETAGGILNSIGLPNAGIDHFIEVTLPSLRGRPRCLVVNIAGETSAEFGELADRLDRAAGIDALEVNLSCPNTAGGGLPFAKDACLTHEVIRLVRGRTSLPVIAKLSPNVTDVRPIAQAAAEAGADALSLINTPLGMSVDWRARRPVLGGIYGGLSGPAVKPLALYHVWQVAREARLPVIGVGGIETADDVLEFIVAGATAVQVGTATFRDPLVIARIVAELPLRLREAGAERVTELRGTLATP